MTTSRLDYVPDITSTRQREAYTLADNIASVKHLANNDEHDIGFHPRRGGLYDYNIE
jgi:hypothetical protein